MQGTGRIPVALNTGGIEVEQYRTDRTDRFVYFTSKAMDLLPAVCISFFSGVVFIVLIAVIVVVTLWKCGVRLEIRQKPPRVEEESSQMHAVPPQSSEPQTPGDAEQGVCRTTTEALHTPAAACYRCSRSVAPSSGRTSGVHVLASLRRRSRKANSDPLHYSRMLHRKARCVSLGTDFQRKRKMSADPFDFKAPCFFGRRPGSLCTWVSDDSIVYENEYIIVISRDRQRAANVCQSCGQKSRPIAQPLSRVQSSERCATPHVTRANTQQRPMNYTSLDRPTSVRTSQANQEAQGRIQHVSCGCSEEEIFAMDLVRVNVADSGFTDKEEAPSEGNSQRHLEGDESELGSEEGQEDAGSDCCSQSMDQPPAHGVGGSRPYIGHALTATTSSCTVYGSLYRSHFSGNQTD